MLHIAPADMDCYVHLLGSVIAYAKRLLLMLFLLWKYMHIQSATIYINQIVTQYVKFHI